MKYKILIALLAIIGIIPATGIAATLTGTNTVPSGSSLTVNSGATFTGLGTTVLPNGMTIGGHAVSLAGNLTTSGAFAIALTATGATSLTLPTSGTLTTTANNLGVFAATTSAQLAGVLSDETGTGLAVFGTSPTLVTPALGTPASGNFSTGAFTWPTFNQNTTGSAATLTTPRTINGVAFDGSGNITVPAAASTLTGGTLASGVTASSLTSVGTLTGGATGAGFTINLGASTISGTLPEANGGFGVDVSAATGVPVFSSGSLTFPHASFGGNAAADAGRVMIFDPSGGFAGTYIVANAGVSGVTADLFAADLQFNQGAHAGAIVPPTLSANRTWTFPDATGTIQLTNGSGASLTGLTSSQMTFTASGTGGTPITITSCLQTNEVLPEMFGAVGDGTTDDSAAFQAAFNAGWSIVCKARTKYVIANVGMKFNHQGIRGLGQSVLLVTNANADGLQVSGPFPSQIPIDASSTLGNYVRDLIIIGPGTYTPSTGSFTGSTGAGIRAAHYGVVTISIASPGVVSWTAHGLIAGNPVTFATTGALPTGLTAGTLYYVSSASLTSNSFVVADTSAHGIAGTNSINTSGSQSGIQSVTAQIYSGDYMHVEHVQCYLFDTAFYQQGYGNGSQVDVDYEKCNHGFVHGNATGNGMVIDGITASFCATDCISIAGGLGWEFFLRDMNSDAGGSCNQIVQSGGSAIYHGGNFEGMSSTGPMAKVTNGSPAAFRGCHFIKGGGLDTSPITSDSGSNLSVDKSCSWGGTTSIAALTGNALVTGDGASLTATYGGETFVIGAIPHVLDNAVDAASSALNGKFVAMVPRTGASHSDVSGTLYYYTSDGASSPTYKRIDMSPPSLYALAGTWTNSQTMTLGHSWTIGAAPTGGGIRMAGHTGGSNYDLSFDWERYVPGDWSLNIGAISNGTPTKNIIFVDGAGNKTTIGHNTNTQPSGAKTLNVEGTLSVTGAVNFGTTNQGDVLYDNGTNFVRLTPGTSGQFLKTNGAAANPAWASATSAIVGTATNDSATAGNLGEFVSSLVASGAPVALTTATAANVASISLTAGDWDVSGNINFAATAATTTATEGGISSASATLPSDGTEVYSGVIGTLASGTDGVTLPRKRFSLSGTTTVYLVGQSTFSAGTVGAFGGITARRVR